MEEKIQKFKQLIEESNNIVFFGGAGVSTESGIPDFRSKDGLLEQEKNRITRYYNYRGVINIKHRNILILRYL